MMLRKTALATIALSLALPLSACSSDKSPRDEKSKATSLKSTAWRHVSANEVKAGGTLRLAIDQLPTNFNDEVRAGADVPSDRAELAPTRGSAIRILADGTWKVDKDYADSVELVSEDPQIVEVKLNKKAVWSDGAPIVANDMIAWWKAMNGSNKDFDVNSSVGVEAIESVKQGEGAFSYTVTFDRKIAEWPAYVYPKLPSSVTATAKAFNKGYVKKAVPSNGPFVISNIDQNAQVITQTPNPLWWGDKPKLDKVIFRVVDPAARAQAFANKELDAVSIGQDKASYDTAKKRADVEIQRSNGLTWTHLTFNGTRGPLKDVKVRQAIGHAINREAMSAAANTPVGAPAITQGSMIYMPGQKGYEDQATPAIGFDIAKSEALLKEAGYTKDANGRQAKDGEPLTLSITVPADTPTNAQRAQLIQGYLKKVGVTIKLETVPSAKYFNDYVIPLNFDMVTFSWQGTESPVSTTQPLFNPIDSGQNFTGITDDKLAGLWTAANAELDPTKQTALANAIDKELYSYVPLITIAPTPEIFVVAKGLVNYGARQFEYPDYTKVGFKK